MGICQEEKGKTANDKLISNILKQNEKEKEDIKLGESSIQKNIVISENEKNIRIHSTPIIPIISYITKSICKLFISGKTGSGFLIKLVKGYQDFYCLMTYGHLFKKELNEMIIKKEELYFAYDSELKVKKINLDNNERYIIKFIGKLEFDIIVIEILPKDNISKEYFLQPNIDYKNNFSELLYHEILIVKYSSKSLTYSFDKIILISNYKFNHHGNTSGCLPGAPVFLSNSVKAIGIQISYDCQSYLNTCYFIWPIYELIKNMPDKENISDKNNYNIRKKPIIINKDEAISVHFISNDQKINHSFPSFPEELFSDVVDKLYEIYPNYKNKSCYFICDGNNMTLNLTMRQNKYKSGAKILIDIN